MSDQAYQQRASRQRRLVIVSILVLVVIGCTAFAVNNTFYDRCTRSFNREPGAVLSSYIDAIRQNDLDRVENCWERNAYFDLNSGCSEICLSRVMGKNFQVNSLKVGPPADGSNGHSTMKTDLTGACPDGKPVAGEAVLDTVSAQVPWKHWRIIRSTVGGSAAVAWCP